MLPPSFVYKRNEIGLVSKLTMNATDSGEEFLLRTCPMNKVVWDGKYNREKITFAIISIILNALSVPVAILMNALVIVAVKTRPRLQNNYNMLLACLAGTDLLVGIICQPSSIAQQIDVIRGMSLNEFCQADRNFFIPLFASLYHLTLLSVERFVAIKYTFRYNTIMTPRRLATAVVTSWVIACLSALQCNR